MQPIDRTGQKFGRLTFVCLTGKKRGGAPEWEFNCDCGNKHYAIAKHVVSGTTKSCGCLHKENGLSLGEKAKTGNYQRKYNPVISSARVIYVKRYNDGCSFEDFFLLSQEPCYYCGDNPQITYNAAQSTKNSDILHYREDQTLYGNFTYNGLDRIDSALSHTIDNILPCCWTCNWMKRNLGLEKFLIHIMKINNRIAQLHDMNTTTIPINLEVFLEEARNYVRRIVTTTNVSIYESSCV